MHKFIATPHSGAPAELRDISTWKLVLSLVCKNVESTKTGNSHRKGHTPHNAILHSDEASVFLIGTIPPTGSKQLWQLREARKRVSICRAWRRSDAKGGSIEAPARLRRLSCLHDLPYVYPDSTPHQLRRLTLQLY